MSSRFTHFFMPMFLGFFRFFFMYARTLKAGKGAQVWSFIDGRVRSKAAKSGRAVSGRCRPARRSTSSGQEGQSGELRAEEGQSGELSGGAEW